MKFSSLLLIAELDDDCLGGPFNVPEVLVPTRRALSKQVSHDRRYAYSTDEKF